MMIHDAIRENNIDEVQAYIASGGNIDLQDKHRRTPLHLAAWSGNIEILNMLLRAKADIRAKAMDNFTLLHFAAQSTSPDAPECIRLIGKKARSIIHMRTSKGKKALIYMILSILHLKVYLIAIMYSGNKSALHLAMNKGRLEIIQALLDIGLEPLAKMSNGQSALDQAKQGINSSNEVKSLLEHYSSVEKIDNSSNHDEGHQDDDEDEDKGVPRTSEDNESSEQTRKKQRTVESEK